MSMQIVVSWLSSPVAVALALAIGLILGSMLSRVEVIRKLVRDAITEKNGESYDVKRILWIWSVVLYNVFCGYALWQDQAHHFSMVEYGTGLGLVLAAGGLNQMLGSKSETPIQ